MPRNVGSTRLPGCTWCGSPSGQQLPLFTPQALHGARLGWQLARLALTFGEDRVRRFEITDPEAPLSERRWTWEPVAGAR